MDENGARGEGARKRDAMRRVGNGIAPENGERLNEPGTGRKRRRTSSLQIPSKVVYE